MFKLLGCLIILIVLIPILLVGGIALRVWNFLNGGQTHHTRQQQGDNTWQAAGGNTRRTAGGKKRQRNAQNSSSPNQIFRDDEGEYVDFEEVD